MMEEELIALLRADAALGAIVPAQSIAFGDVAQGAAYPFIACNTVSGTAGVSYAGPDGMEQGRVQIDCFASTYIGARHIARLVIGLLNGHADTTLRGLFLLSQRDLRDGGGNDPARPYRVSLDFATNWRL